MNSPDMFESSQDMSTLVDMQVDTEVIDFRLQKPVNYQESGRIVWLEKQMSSPWSARPLLVSLLREKRCTVREFIREYLEHEVRSLTSYSGDVSLSPGSWVLWSPRGGKVVGKEDCRIIKTTGRTVLLNPVRAKRRKQEQWTRRKGAIGLGSCGEYWVGKPETEQGLSGQVQGGGLHRRLVGEGGVTGTFRRIMAHSHNREYRRKEQELKKQQPEKQQPEKQEPEKQEPEKQEHEMQEPEKQELEKQEPEKQEREGQGLKEEITKKVPEST